MVLNWLVFHWTKSFNGVFAILLVVLFLFASCIVIGLWFFSIIDIIDLKWRFTNDFIIFLCESRNFRIICKLLLLCNISPLVLAHLELDLLCTTNLLLLIRVHCRVIHLCFVWLEEASHCQLRFISILTFYWSGRTLL